MIGEEQNNYHLNTFSKTLISWHKIHGRHNLPWQKKINPYRVWISEVMLQQTQVKTVLPYYKNFMKKYPDIKSLSHSDLDEILKSWTGLGYYRRARNLYETSQILKNRYKYKFPESYEEILELPGIGKSTAGAILSIAYNKKYPILDGNVKRVIWLPYGVDVEIMPNRGVRLEMDTNLPHRIDETTVESIKISEKGRLRSMDGRLVYMSMDMDGREFYSVEAFSKQMDGYVWDYVTPGESVMVLTITYRVAPNVLRTE